MRSAGGGAQESRGRKNVKNRELLHHSFHAWKETRKEE